MSVTPASRTALITARPCSSGGRPLIDSGIAPKPIAEIRSPVRPRVVNFTASVVFGLPGFRLCRRSFGGLGGLAFHFLADALCFFADFFGRLFQLLDGRLGFFFCL